MRNFEKTRKQREEHIQEFLSHTPTTDILDRIKAAPLPPHPESLLRCVLITVEIAKDLLTLNRENRPHDYHAIRRYSTFMVEEKWIFIGDVIRITATMKLIDAQQRLLAIIESGIPQVMHIQTGLGETAFGAIDANRTRTGADALAIAGYGHVNVLAAAMKADIYFREQRKVGQRVSVRRVHPMHLIEWAANKQNNLKLMLDCMDQAIKYFYPRGKFLAQSTWTFLYYTLAKIRGAKQQATNFMTLLANGENVSLGNETSPIYLLREKLTSISNEKYLSGRSAADLKIRYIVTAWNHYRQGTILTKLTIDTKSIDLPQPI